MSRQEKVHVFWGAPPASSLGNLGDQHNSASWISLEVKGSDGRLRPDADGTTVAAWNTEVLPAGPVHEYLDLSFPMSPAPDPAAEPGPPPQVNCRALSVQSGHLSMWTASQALVLKGTPTPKPTSPSISSSSQELFSPETLSPSGPHPPVQEEGVVLQVTTEGLLCSQEAEPLAPRPGAPPVEQAGTTTPLSLCVDPSARYTILVAVVHPCHLKEVKVKSGRSAGTLIPLASLVVTDQSDVEMKVVLWRRAAFWVLTVGPGDIVRISGLQVNEDRWRGERVLQSTFSSKLLNLGQVTPTSCPAAPQQVQPRTLTALCRFLRQQRPLLASLPPRRAQNLSRLPYASLCSLRSNTLVHARLRVTHCYTCTEWKPEAEPRSRSGLQRLAVVMVEQDGGQDGTLVLWGGATSWLQRFETNKETIWDVRFLLVWDGSSSDRPELHSTPWSSVRALGPSDTQQCPPSSGASLEIDLRTLLSQKFTGEVRLHVQVQGFQFQQSSQTGPQPLLNSSSSLAGIMAALRGDVTYAGCARCGSELDTDANHIYRACYPCLPFTAVRTFYRAAVMTLGGPDQAQVCVQVPPLALQEILMASPQKIGRPSGSDEEVRVAAEKILDLLDLPKKTFDVTLQSVFLCDENSVAVSQEFTLLHMKPLENATFT